VAIAGVGVTAAASATGAARFDDVAAHGAAVLARVVTIGDGPAPRLLGGFSFAPRGAAPTGAWTAFGDTWFALPRWTYERRGNAAWLVLAIGPAEARDRARLHAEHAAAVAALAEPLAVPRARAEATMDLPRGRWTEAIEDIRAKIAAGHCRKVVAARVRKVELAAPVDIAAVLAELGRRHPECTRFGVRRGSAAFVGASPERLIRRRGDEVDSEALAGSIARPARAAATDDRALAMALLDSTKDRGEHDLVVRAIEQGLGPWCRELSVPETPVVRTLRHVLHLHTPVHGTLFAARHVLALAAALHPTPAVGGTPTAAALSWIATHEPAARGWYAAPVGWFDADGDGELAVAIRSGLIDGATATLHAGAGIVRDSDAAAEWAETEVKLRALSGALGLEETAR
jgi:menaquinone-specific isochorismate synthase